MFTIWQGAFFNALEDKDQGDFFRLLLWGRYDSGESFAPGFSLTVLIFVPATVYASYFQQQLQIHWRKWQTDWFLQRWLSNTVYYQLESHGNAPDNPDQRVSEDIRLFVDHCIELLVGLLRALVTLLSFLAVLWVLSESVETEGSIVSGSLVWIALGYAAVGTLLAHLIGRRLITLNYTRERAEANFRFRLMGLRRSAESIAFYKSEPSEKRFLDADFDAIVSNWKGIIIATRNLLFFQTGFGQVALVVPIALVAPAYFAGRIQLGAIFQTSNAFVQVQESFSWIVNNYTKLTEWAATTHRLTRFDQSMRSARSAGSAITHQPGTDQRLVLQDVSATLPDGRQVLNKVSLRIERGERVWLSGRSGSGKSTVLRVVAGLWPSGTGTVTVPQGSRLFLPQKPYMPDGTLKQCICYPCLPDEQTDKEVLQVLEMTGLSDVLPDLQVTDNWERRLSGGEKQRVGFARALLTRPDWLFMDEATANLDEEAELSCHRLLDQYLPNATVISVLHRSAAGQFYNRRISLAGGVIT